ncbi:MAG: hypothetical protein K8S97_15185 [Anaerolineae bacterium]|nr:hypothetical protein [Anaerolineae bacterium]
MNDPSSPMGWHVWRRGSLLGMQWFAVFVVVTALLYLLLGVIGWSGIAQAMCAMFSGPVIGTAVIVAWWIARRPTMDPDVPSKVEDEGKRGDE